jgi:hypothetical protein
MSYEEEDTHLCDATGSPYLSYKHVMHVSSSSYDMHVFSSSYDMHVSSSSYDMHVSSSSYCHTKRRIHVIIIRRVLEKSVPRPAVQIVRSSTCIFPECRAFYSKVRVTDGTHRVHRR